MRTPSKIIKSLLLSLAVGQGFADSIADDLQTRLILQRSMFPQEKIHVMTDRELYQPGDTVWMRAWVLDGESLKPRHRGSRFVYTELRDGIDSLRRCVKIKEQEGRFVSQMILPNKLASGDYTLVAYTQYMLGTSEEFIFRKNIHIISAEDAKKGYTARALYEGYKPEASELKADPNRPFSFYRRDTLMRVTFDVPDSTWLAISLTDDQLTPTDTTVTITRMLPNLPTLFTLENIATDSVYYKPPYRFERYQKISGEVLDNPSKRINTISLINLTKPQILTTETDEKGKFSFNGIDSPDSTIWAVTGRMPNGRKINEIKIDGLMLPAIIHHLPSDANLYYVNTKREELKLASIQNTNILPINTAERKKGIQLDEHRSQISEAQDSEQEEKEEIKQDKVIKQILEAKDLDDIYARLADDTKFSYLESAYKYDNINAIIKHFKGIHFIGDVAMYMEEGYEAAPVRFFINTTEIPIELDENGYYKPQKALQFPVELVFAVDYINPDKASGIGETDYPFSPIVRLDLKKENALAYMSGPKDYFKIQMPLGYSKRFYFPNYKVIHQPRSTRFWNPEVYTGNTGKVTLELPLPNDYHTSYTLRAEGVTPGGELISIIHRIVK